MSEEISTQSFVERSRIARQALRETLTHIDWKAAAPKRSERQNDEQD